jgi:uncharacterized protein (DUF488 family)
MQSDRAKMSDPGNPAHSSVQEPVGGLLFTIGYGNRSIDQFISVLQVNAIHELIDVRTAPYSRFKPEFSRDALRAALERHGIAYFFMGDTLGGHPEPPACYTDGKVDYDKLRTQPFFRAGIDHLKTLLRPARRLALMCSEGRPEECHRSKLIGETLDAQQIQVCHIDEDNRPCTQAEVIQRLTGGQMDLFGPPTFTSRKRYVSRPREEQT